MDDEPMWVANRVVAPTPDSAITIPETANKFAIKDTENEVVHLMMFPLSLTGEAKTWLDKLNERTIEMWDELRTAFVSRFFPPTLFDRLLGEIRAFSQHENKSLTNAWLRMKKMLRNCHGHNLSKGNIIKIFYHGLNEVTQEVLKAAVGGIFLYKTPNQAYQLLEDKVLLKLDWAKNQKTKSSLKKTVAFAAEGSSNCDNDKIMARMDVMTMKMDAQYKDFQSRSKQPNLEDDIPMSCEEEAKFMQTFRPKFDRLADKQSGRPSGSLPSNTQPNPKGSSSKPYQPSKAQNEHVNAVFTWSGKSYDPPDNPNDQQNNSETPINFDSDEEDDEPTPQPKYKIPKPVKETPTPKPYKLKIPYPQCLIKEKMEAQYGKFIDMIRAVRINVPLVDVLAEMPNYGKFLKEIVNNKHKIEQISAAFLSDESSAILQNKVLPKLGYPRSFLIPSKNMLVEVAKFIFPIDFVILEMEEDSKVPLILGRPFLHTAGVVIRVKQKQLNLGVGAERMIFHINSAMKQSYSNDDTCFSIDVINEILEEDFDALLDKGSEILHSIEGTILEEKLFAEFDEFMAMTTDENSKSESDTEEPPFEKITFNTDYKIKTSLEKLPTDLELKHLPDNLEYVFLEETSFLPVIISSQLSEENKNKLVSVLKRHKQAFAWKTTDIPGICPSFCKHKIQLLEDKPVVQKQRRLNPNMQEVMKKEIIKLLDTGIIYPITDSPWVSPIHCVPKKGGITVVTNERNEFVPTRTVTATFQRCMLAIFHDTVEESVEVFMENFSVFGSSFDHCMNNLDKMIQRCKDAHLILNWEKCHFMVK
ncbi:reverse transcriptase domain-containing protein [Tanacetum coccineum]|uniref:Reverse transcriptase domain-containing protein n=1 Tax=Tanacetum coccineum TaxID=301880 RepID=A0ABQ5G8C8_9ASTR